MSSSSAPVSGRPRPTANQVFRKYYKENDIFLSAEGVLKVISIIGCIVCSAVLLRGAGAAQCARTPALLASGGTGALVVAAVSALLYASVALRLPLRAPQVWLYTDIVVSSVSAVLMLLTAVLSLALCGAVAGGHVYGVVSLCLVSGTLTAATVLTYSSAMSHWDEPAEVQGEGAPSGEHDV